jgi:hypothetical protein
MTIHIESIFDAVMLTFVYLMFIGVMVLFILWPINDRPVNVGQKITFGIASIVTAIFWYGWAYGLIHFTK